MPVQCVATWKPFPGINKIHSVMKKYLHQNMQAIDSLKLNCGQAVVFSSPSPLKADDGNEDACALVPISGFIDLLVLADGVGGHRGGQDAAAITVESMCELSQENIAANEILREPILSTIEHCNQSLLAQGLGAATTLIIAEIQGNQVRPYYVGDSTILITGQRGVIKFQSIAQSPVGYALESGLIEKDHEAINENSHWVSNIIGMSDMHMTVGPPLELAPRDTLLLCCDGLTDNLGTDAIISMIRKGPLLKAAENLRAACQAAMNEENGHPDDLSFILYRLN